MQTVGEEQVLHGKVQPNANPYTFEARVGVEKAMTLPLELKAVKRKGVYAYTVGLVKDAMVIWFETKLARGTLTTREDAPN